MGEFWDIYDENRVKTGRTAERDKYEFKEGEYRIVVTGIILNSKFIEYEADIRRSRK